jgi:predicted signal transduction protein with EAL and GGDEF domain
MNTCTYLCEKGKEFWTIAGIVLVIVIAIIQFLAGYELAFSLFYLLPISLSTRFGGRSIGIATSAASAFCWFAVEAMSGHAYPHPAIPYWNSAIRFCVFLIVTFLISALKKAHEHESELARTDNLTGAVNTRFFYELMQMAINRSERNMRPFTVACVDLDNFKYVNDHYCVFHAISSTDSTLKRAAVPRDSEQGFHG